MGKEKGSLYLGWVFQAGAFRAWCAALCALMMRAGQDKSNLSDEPRLILRIYITKGRGHLVKYVFIL